MKVVAREVFGYRSPVGFLFVAILALLCAMWLGGILAIWDAPRINVNERPLSREAALQWRWIVLGVGLASSTAVGALLAWCLNCRVEIEAGMVRGYDLLGRLNMEGPLASARIEVDKSKQRARIVAETGTMRVNSGIRNFAQLRMLLHDPTVSRPPSGQRYPKSSYVPKPQTFAYRWNAHHLVSFPWIGGMLFVIAMFVQSPQRGELPFYAIFAIFLAPGIWMQLAGWQERIRLGPDGIEWIDCLGRSRVRAELDEIVGLEIEEGDETNTLRIETLRGKIPASEYLPGARRLMDEIRHLVQGRNP